MQPEPIVTLSSSHFQEGFYIPAAKVHISPRAEGFAVVTAALSQVNGDKYFCVCKPWLERWLGAANKPVKLPQSFETQCQATGATHICLSIDPIVSVTHSICLSLYISHCISLNLPHCVCLIGSLYACLSLCLPHRVCLSLCLSLIVSVSHFIRLTTSLTLSASLNLQGFLDSKRKMYMVISVGDPAQFGQVATAHRPQCSLDDCDSGVQA